MMKDIEPPWGSILVVGCLLVVLVIWKLSEAL